jgi:DNA-binding CsgD family transcriptional regulator
MAEGAAAGFLTGCVMRDTMPFALDQLAARAGGDGAVLVRSRADIPVGAVASRHIVEPVAAYIAGDRPVDPRIARVRPSLDEGFRLDQDDFSMRSIERDAYYQEFLRPRGFGWNACAILADEPNGEAVHVSIKRRLDRGPFSHADVAAVERELPLLRAALRFTQPFEPAVIAVSKLLVDTRRYVIGLNVRGEAFEINGKLDGSSTIAISDGAIVWSNRVEQPKLDAALARLLRTQLPVAIVLAASDGNRWSLRIRPWTGLRSHIAYVAIISALDAFEEPGPEWLAMTRAMFGFSTAEAKVAAFLGQGLSISDTARRLALSQSTVRNQLKAVFAKAGVRRQVELSVLLSRL